MIKLYKLPDNPKIEGLRPMKNKDISQVHKLLNDYLKLKKKKLIEIFYFFSLGHLKFILNTMRRRLNIGFYREKMLFIPM